MIDAEATRSIWKHLMRTEFRQAWIDAGGIRTRYVQAGDPDAPALVMLPGTASSWETFCANLEAHARYFNCIALDMIGSGFSDKPDKDYEIADYVAHILAFMDAISVARASFIGVSLGAWIGARIASSHPERVDRLILLAPSGMLVHTQTMNRIRGTRTKAVDDPSWENIKSVFEPLIYDEQNRIPDLIAVRQAVYQLPTMKRAMGHVLCLQNPEIRSRNILQEDEWRRIQAPTLVVLAPDDSEAFYQTGLRALDFIPDARSIEMRQVKHWPHFERPDEFNRASLTFLLEAHG
ncbi:alpha/beta hydrolase [Microbacteriaceae bacterium K1510]|nr:alpha/beta hydrolase [Microbacteriaceae bacterium K1510]